MAARLVGSIFDRHLRPAGLEATQMMTLWVAFAEDSATAGAIARAIGTEQSTASRTMANLRKRGLLRLSPAPHDRRVQLVSVTPRGLATLLRAYPLWEQAQKEVQTKLAGLIDAVGTGRQLRMAARKLQAVEAVEASDRSPRSKPRSR